MKLETIFQFCTWQLLITIAAMKALNSEANFPDNVEYFTLKFRNGTEISAVIKELPAIQLQLEKDFRKLPRYEEILGGGSKKMDSTLKQMQKEGASRMELSTVGGNIVADTYEELFAEAGLKLKIYNRQPIFLV